MTREEAKELVSIMQAYAEGKDIQYLAKDDSWVDNEDMDITPGWKYRIKPEKDYRPFEDCAELMVEFAKRFNVSNIPSYAEPLIWVKDKETDSRYLITGYENIGIYVGGIWRGLDEFYERYVFLDGSCCGVEK